RSRHPRGGRRRSPDPPARQDPPRPHRRGRASRFRGSARPRRGARSLVVYFETMIAHVILRAGGPKNLGARGSRSFAALRMTRGVVVLLLLAVSAAALDVPPLSLPQSLFRSHRYKFLAKLPANALAILRSAPPRTSSNDVEYVYRQ